MTITLRAGSTVMFTGDSITDCRRSESEQGLGSGYPLHVAGEWGFRHPDRPVTWLNTGIAGDKVMDLEAAGRRTCSTRARTWCRFSSAAMTWAGTRTTRTAT